METDYAFYIVALGAVLAAFWLLRKKHSGPRKPLRPVVKWLIFEAVTLGALMLTSDLPTGDNPDMASRVWGLCLMLWVWGSLFLALGGFVSWLFTDTIRSAARIWKSTD